MSAIRSCFVALGSNQGDSRRILSLSVAKVATALGGKVRACSKLYASAAELVTNQPDFLNAVVQIDLPDGRDPKSILSQLKELEGQYEKSQQRFGPRELDLDLIGFSDNLRGEWPDVPLSVPHERAHLRDFVLRPLCDLPNGGDLSLGPDHAPARTLLSSLEEQTAFPLRNAIFSPHKKWNAEPDLDPTLIMGVLNVTPDSFSDGGKYNASVSTSVERAIELCAQGADVVDIGGESTRPFADPVSEAEELDRVIPVIEALESLDPEQFPASISVDTRKPSVARAAVLAGADIVNDQFGELDEERAMLMVAGELGVPIVTMHARGDARTMESLILDPAQCKQGDVVEHIWDWLEERANAGLQESGVPTWNVMIDPGLGFAKTNEQNLDVLAQLEQMVKRPYAFPVLIGASRKRFVKQLTTFDVDSATSATTATAALAGAAMVRVHAVQQARDTLNVSDAIRRHRALRFPFSNIK